MRASVLLVLAALAICLFVLEVDAHKNHRNKKSRGLLIPMRKHRALHNRVKHRSGRANNDQFSQMLVNDLDTYSVEVNLGGNHQKFLLNLDTGSNDLLVYSPTCPKANCPGNTFDATTSESFIDPGCTASGLACGTCADSKCGFHAAYADGAFADGSVVRDKINLGDLADYPVESFFGVINAAGGNSDASDAFYTNASLSGILGLAPTGAGSAFGHRSVILDLAERYDFPVGFTLCLRPFVGGALIVGEDYSDRTVATYLWTPQTMESMYTVKVDSIHIGYTATEGDLKLKFDNVLLDSGTTNIVFPASAKASVQGIFQSICDAGTVLKGICSGGLSIWNNWIQLADEERIAFPDIYFTIAGVYKTMRLIPSMYMTEFNGYYTMNLDFEGSDLVLGNGFMKNFRIGFDVANRRIGFADLSTCPGDNDISELKNDPNSFKVEGVAKPIGMNFENSRAYQYAWFCGWEASDVACSASSDVNCKTSLATRPAFDASCPADWNYAIGQDVEYQARWGQALSARTGQAGVGMDMNLVTAVPPYSTPFVFATMKYYNAPVDPNTYIDSILVRTTVNFLKKTAADPEKKRQERISFAEFTYDMVLKITNYHLCEDMGCPWNDPEQWPEKFINDECTQFADGEFHLKTATGPLCCPYYTSQNDYNQCSDLVEIVDDGNADNDFVTLDGETYKIKLVGFHAAVPGHRGRGLIEGFAADFGQLTKVNVHAQLIDLCPDCPPGTQQIKNNDGSCSCACTQLCDLPLSTEPDCSCVARVSHSHCAADCNEADVLRALDCDKTYGEVYTTSTDCLCRCVKGCPSGYRQIPNKCDCVCDCDPKAAPPAGFPAQHTQCNKWVCNDNGVGCKYISDGGNACSKYQWPLAGAAKDPECWAPKCVDVGARAECQGSAMNVNPAGCPVPAGVSAHCYVHKCAGDGYCSTEFISSSGGKEAGTAHLGNCPVPAGMDARCYWPYCDATGNCKGDVFTGKAYTAGGNWEDGSMGTRPGQAACTVQELSDAGNAKYGKFNPECFVARCDGGKCGGDAVNYGEACSPIDGRGTTGGYNEVFVGGAWPGISADCVYYVCGTEVGERGHCIQRALPGARQTPCYNSDDDKCTLDWCDGEGMCKDHEWITGHHAEGVCVTSTCDPKSGEWTYERNGDSCCENGVINFGEQCEVGVNGADDKCCVDCYLKNSCDDENVCTTETCVSGACVASLDLSGSDKCPALDGSVEDNKCRMSACSAESGKCESMPDPRQDGVVCGGGDGGDDEEEDDDTDSCNHRVCDDGKCVEKLSNEGVACMLAPLVELPALTCQSLKCVKLDDGRGSCQAVNDDAQSCADTDLCTAEKCLEGRCVSDSAVACLPAADDCHAAAVCNPVTGACDSLALPDGTVCGVPSDAHPMDACTSYVCAAGACVRDDSGACKCGNGKLDEDEQCDYTIAAQAQCCSKECTGCACGNGKIDEGEQCDFAIPSQLQCCNSECEGCLCGNGVLDDGEECDPVLAKQNDECCMADCTPCAVAARSANYGVAIGAAVAGLVVAFALAALVAVKASSAAAVGGAAPGAAPAAVSTNNPAYVEPAGGQNPLYSPLTI